MFSIPIPPCFLLLSLFLNLNDSDVVYRFLHTNQYDVPPRPQRLSRHASASLAPFCW